MYRLLSVLLLSGFLLACSPSSNEDVIQVSPIESAGLQSNEFAVIIDVRSQSEWNEQHIPGAIHIPLRNLEARFGDLEKFEGKQLIMQCAVGGRSSKAVVLLQQAGFSDVVNMDGGIVAWKKANLPVE
mgnify:CR=1 FL=1